MDMAIKKTTRNLALTILALIVLDLMGLELSTSFSAEDGRAKVDDFDFTTFQKRLAPRPQKFEFFKGFYDIKNGCAVEISMPSADESAKEFAKESFKKFWNADALISLKADPSAADIKAEGYKISASDALLKISAPDSDGLHNALKTLRQLADPKPLGKTLHGYILPLCEIDDFPLLKMRVIQLGLGKGVNPKRIEQLIRLAAYYKFNAVILSLEGTFVSEKHPQFFWESDVPRSEIKRLIEVAKKEGLKVIPQWHICGHANNSSFRACKHSALDFHPELQPYFEPLGYSWCMSNPESKKVLADIVNELCDIAGNPEYFSLGLDEVYDLATCSECRKRPAKDLLREHILYFKELLEKRGIKTFMWHDMLLAKNDPRWKGYNANARDIYNLDDLYKELPKDIIICDWQYSEPKSNPGFPSIKFFTEAGFEVWGAAWTDGAAARKLAAALAAENQPGFVATTWGKYTGLPVVKIFLQSSAAAWGSPMEDKTDTPNVLVRRLNFARHVRQIGWDMGVDKYDDTGVISDNYREPPLY